jgi:hypothetical protein
MCINFEVTKIEGFINPYSIYFFMGDNNFNLTDFTLGVTSVGAGVYHGFCDAKKIPIIYGSEEILTYAPIILRAGLGGVVGGLAGLLAGGILGVNISSAVGGILGVNELSKEGDSNTKVTGKSRISSAVREGVCAAGVGVVGGVARGTFQTFFGYALGYLSGV